MSDLERATGLARWLFAPLLRFNLLDRALALGGQAFGALIPLLLVLQTAQPGSRSMANDLIARFDLHDDAAEAVRETFEATSGETTITGISVLVLVVSVLSFTRRLQRLYEDTWQLDQNGFKGTGWGCCSG